MRFRCPHCGAFGGVRTSNQISATVTWLYVQCGDLECSHSWRVDAEATVTLSPSAKPDPQVNIPLSPHVRRGLLGHMLAALPTGNHTPRTTRPSTADLFESMLLDPHTPATRPTG